MRWFWIILAIVLGVAVVLARGYFAWSWHQIGDFLGKTAPMVIAAFGAAVAVVTYRRNLTLNRILRDVEMRMKFTTGDEFKTIVSLIEHEDATLGRILQVLNERRTEPHHQVLTTKDDRKLHQDLDDYLNFLEALASLDRRRWMKPGDLAGLWTYYLMRLWEWEPLRNYVFDPQYKWWDLWGIIAKLNNKKWRKKYELRAHRAMKADREIVNLLRREPGAIQI